jgi:REP element-mobilizing transposase RayT
VVEEKNEVTLLLVHNERVQDKENMWYLENKTSNHMCEDKDKFMELDETIRSNVIFVDHSKVAIKGKCTILIKLRDESHQFINDVYYISTVKKTIY